MTPRDVVICLVSDTFADVQRRGFYSTADQTLLSLVAAPSVRRILVVDHPRGLASQVNRRVHGDRPAPRSGKLRGVRPAAVRTPNPLDEQGLIRRYRAFDQQIALAATLHGLHRPALITFNLFHAGFGSRHWSNGSVFYAQDDEAEIPRLEPWRALIKRAYARAAGRHDIVAVSAELGRRIGPAVSVIPNGLDPLMWRTPAIPVPSTSSAPTAVYAGTIDRRVDIAAFVQLAAAGFVVRLAGPVPVQEVRDRLAATDGIELLGSMRPDRIVELLGSADVCVLAHSRSSLTDAMSPLKLFEYRASGTPVIATDLAGIREAWPDGELVPPGGDYVTAAGRAIATGRMDEAARLALVGEYSWRRRHEPLISRLGVPEARAATWN